MVKYTGTTGDDFVALQLALDFEDFDGAADKTTAAAKDSAAAKDPAAATAAPTTEAAPAAEGESAPDKSEHEAAVANTMDYGGVPNATAAAAPKEGEEAKKADAAAAKDPAAAKKAGAAAGAPTKPAYSPILDEDVNMVGICNKAHKKTVNLIQVIYCKASTNAMM